MALNDYVRATENVGIIIETSTKNKVRLIQALKQWGEGHGAELSPDDFDDKPGAVRIVEDFPLDVFNILSGKTYEDYLPLAKETDDGILFLDRQSPIDSKEGTGREKDKLDISVLRRLIEEQGK